MNLTIGNLIDRLGQPMVRTGCRHDDRKGLLAIADRPRAVVRVVRHVAAITAVADSIE